MHYAKNRVEIARADPSIFGGTFADFMLDKTKILAIYSYKEGVI